MRPPPRGSDRGRDGALRAVFVNEGELGRGVMGHPRLEDALRVGLSHRSDVDPQFVRLPPMGAGARLVTRQIPGLGHLDLDLQPVRWHAVQAVRARAAVGRAVRTWPADVLHVHSHSIALGLGSLMERLPTVLSLDATIWDWQAMEVWRPLRRHSRTMLAPSLAAERRAFARSAAAVAWSAWSARGAARASPTANVVQLHPGLDLERFRPAPKQRRDRPRILFVGGRFAEKGGYDLLAALEPQLAAGAVELDLVTAAEVSPPHGVRVHRLSSRDERLVELLQQADVFCLPTLGDSNPWVLLEAMACGTAVVATGIGAIPELLDEGRSGVLVAPGDRRGLGDALRTLVEREDRRRELGGEARTRCERHYDARRQTALLVDLLSRVRDGAGPEQTLSSAS